MLRKEDMHLPQARDNRRAIQAEKRRKRQEAAGSGTNETTGDNQPILELPPPALVPILIGTVPYDWVLEVLVVLFSVDLSFSAPSTPSQE